MNETFLYNHKLSKNSDFNIWLAFPAVYSFGMSSLGYLSIFKALDENENFNVERIFLDSKTTQIQFKNVDVIGFSFSFEMDILSIFKMLEKYKIPFKSENRNVDYPLIFAGGPVLTSNPEPYCDFFDFILTGDGENKNEEVMDFIKKNKNLEKSLLLKKLSEIEGIYVPSISQKKVKKLTSNLQNCVSTPILTQESYFKNTFIIEVSRGCPNRCGFCLASYLNLPVRFIGYEQIIEQIKLGLKYTDKIAFLGASVCSNPDFEKICDYILNSNKKIELSVSSLKADFISPKIIQTLVKCGQKHATIAIEAGSQRLRNLINKNLTQEQILKTVEIAYKNGLKGLKIYAMIGLPTETQEDIDAILELGIKIKKIYKTFDLTFSFATFVPKAQTPFQYAKREDIKSLEKKYAYIKKQFAKNGIKVRISSVKWDEVQSILSRGNRNFSDYLVEVYAQGANLGAFRTVYKQFEKEKKLPKLSEILDEIDINSDLPWDFIENQNKEILKKEYLRLIKI